MQFSHDWSSAVNNAYRTLKNPVSRAKYLVEKEFGSIEEKIGKVPVDMAEAFFEIQDVMDTIRTPKKSLLKRRFRKCDALKMNSGGE